MAERLSQSQVTQSNVGELTVGQTFDVNRVVRNPLGGMAAGKSAARKTLASMSCVCSTSIRESKRSPQVQYLRTHLPDIEPGGVCDGCYFNGTSHYPCRIIDPNVQGKHLIHK